jgi:hypothetical protein
LRGFEIRRKSDDAGDAGDKWPAKKSTKRSLHISRMQGSVFPNLYPQKLPFFIEIPFGKVLALKANGKEST